MSRFAVAAFVALLVGPLAAGGQTIRAGKNTMMLRGQEEEIYYYAPPADAAGAPPVLFLPGDGGWRGDVIDMAREVARDGYRVYGWDIKDYLEDFTGKTRLTEAEIADDIAAVTGWVRKSAPQKVVLVGWSQGAGMVVLAAASAEHKSLYAGVVGIGTPPHAALGWRFVDNLSYVTKKAPDEPMFPVTPYLPRMAPLHYAAIIATHDEDIPLPRAKELFAAAQEPKREFVIEAQSHDFGSNRPAFYAALREALAWVRQP